MSWLYLFNADGTCAERREHVDPQRTNALLAHCTPAAHCISDEAIDIHRARLVDGVLCDVEPVVTEQVQWIRIRAQRDSLLAVSDWTQMPDVPLTTKGAWAAYRQALRDVTQQSDPFSIVWPAAPS